MVLEFSLPSIMGALTLRSFPFELRGWDIAKFLSYDPTDSFGASTIVYISQNRIVQIEPDFDIKTSKSWITDKARLFFDGISETFKLNALINKSWLKNSVWTKMFKSLVQNVYFVDHLNKQTSQKFFFTFIFENVSLEILAILLLLSQNYSFVRLGTVGNMNLENDLESKFLLNSVSNEIMLANSTLSLLMGINPRYEGVFLNLSLRHRFLKGNYGCYSVGPFIDLTFPLYFLGSNYNVINNISKGNHIVCQDLKLSMNPSLVSNSQMFKRHDGYHSLNAYYFLNYSNILNRAWNGLNILSSSFSQTSNHFLNSFKNISTKDLYFSEVLYFLNVINNKISKLMQIIDLRILNVLVLERELRFYSKMLFNQNYATSNDVLLKKDYYYYIPSTTFYENEETFITTEGYCIGTTKLISNNMSKSNWKILRNLFYHLKLSIKSLNQKDSLSVFLSFNKMAHLQTFKTFQYQAIKTLSSSYSCLSIQSQTFVMFNVYTDFKFKALKSKFTKLKCWLDDFFSGGKDQYTSNSLVLANSSNLLRLESTNFF